MCSNIFESPSVGKRPCVKFSANPVASINQIIIEDVCNKRKVTKCIELTSAKISKQNNEKQREKSRGGVDLQR